MAEFVLNRKHTLRSLTGHTVTFEKGVPTYVPEACVREVLAIGGERIDATQDAGMDDTKTVKEDPAGVEREELLFACFDDLISTNKREDFTAQGAPHIKAVKASVGFTIDNKERDLVWAKYRIMKGAEE